MCNSTRQSWIDDVLLEVTRSVSQRNQFCSVSANYCFPATGRKAVASNKPVGSESILTKQIRRSDQRKVSDSS